jgi:hypothetical protein
MFPSAKMPGPSVTFAKQVMQNSLFVMNDANK